VLFDVSVVNMLARVCDSYEGDDGDHVPVWKTTKKHTQARDSINLAMADSRAWIMSEGMTSCMSQPMDEADDNASCALSREPVAPPEDIARRSTV
jgi:hypothetical protein